MGEFSVMIDSNPAYDVVVIGSGPAGQNAALEAADLGARVLVIERERQVGGACVQYGTIPSKTLRETAVTLTAFRRRSGNVYRISRDRELCISSLMTRLDQVVTAHHETTGRCLELAGVERAHGRASFLSDHEVAIQSVTGATTVVTGEKIVVATGSRPRSPDNICVDHENILDSDSILAMTYLPQSLLVLGGGVIACEYASTFASLGVEVTIVDKWPTPLGFLDPELVEVFTTGLTGYGGIFLGNRVLKSMHWDGVSSVVVSIENGEVLRAEKALVAQGRVANLDVLQIQNAGLEVTDRGLLAVNDFCQTDVDNIYAVGDTIGPPALASASMEQGRRAIRHALTGAENTAWGLIPTGIYTIPELATVGMDEKQAAKKFGGSIVGRANYDRLARAHIMAADNGLLKLIADPHGDKLLGVQAAGDGATELVSMGQIAIVGNMSVDTFATSTFNFPTLAEAYRIAALEIIHQRETTPTIAGSENAMQSAGIPA